MFNPRAVHALNIAASGFQSYTANRQSAWYRLRTKDTSLMEEHGVADFLEAADDILYAEFSRSGFYECVGEITPDTHGPGTGFGYIEEDFTKKRIIFLGRHFLSAWIDENSTGEVDIVDEEVLLALRDIVSKFPEERLESSILDRVKKEPYSTRLIRHRIMPMDERYLSQAQRAVDKRMPFISIWYDDKTSSILDVGGYWEFPFIVSRFRKNSGEVYGRSPGQDALGLSMGAQQMTKSRIALGQRISDPTMIVDPDLEGQDDFLPGGRVYASGKQRVEPVPIAGSYPITVDVEERTEKAIDEHFMVQIYMMLQQATGTMTAREVMERMGEKAAVLGYITGRFQKEVLQPAIRRTFNLLLRSGRLPRLPEALIQAQEAGGLEIEFLGFFAQIQKKYYATSGINTALEYAGVAAKIFGPEVLDNVDGNELLRTALDNAGAPQRSIRERKDVQNIRAARAAQLQAAQAQQAAAANQQAVLQNMDKMGKAPEPGSPLEQLSQQLVPTGGMV